MRSLLLFAKLLEFYYILHIMAESLILEAGRGTKLLRSANEGQKITINGNESTGFEHFQ